MLGASVLRVAVVSETDAQQAARRSQARARTAQWDTCTSKQRISEGFLKEVVACWLTGRTCPCEGDQKENDTSQ